MRKIYITAVKCLEGLVGLLFFVVAAITLSQVFFRYVLRNPFTWAHEVAILLMVWAVWIGAAVGIHRKAHLRIDLFKGRFSLKVQKILTALFDSFILIFLLVVVVKGVGVVQSMEGIYFISVDLPKGLMFAAAPVGALFMILLFFPTLVQDLRGIIRPGEKE